MDEARAMLAAQNRMSEWSDSDRLVAYPILVSKEWRRVLALWPLEANDIIAICVFDQLCSEDDSKTATQVLLTKLTKSVSSNDPTVKLYAGFDAALLSSVSDLFSSLLFSSLLFSSLLFSFLLFSSLFFSHFRLFLPCAPTHTHTHNITISPALLQAILAPPTPPAARLADPAELPSDPLAHLERSAARRARISSVG